MTLASLAARASAASVLASVKVLSLSSGKVPSLVVLRALSKSVVLAPSLVVLPFTLLVVESLVALFSVVLSPVMIALWLCTP